MTIRSRLRLNMIIALLATALVAVALILGASTIARLRQSENRAHEITRGIGDLQTLTYDYLIYSEERPRVQWTAQSTALQALLSSWTPSSPEGRALQSSILQRLFRMQGLFGQLVSAQAGQGAAETGTAPLTSIEERLMSALLSESQYLMDDSAQFARINEAVSTRSIWWVVGLISASVVVVSGAAVSANRATQTALGGPMEQLLRGTQRIARGDLGHRLAMGRRDELGALGDAMDHMAEALSQSETTNQALLRAIPDRLVRVAADGTLLTYYPGTATEFAIPPDEIVGRRVSELFPAEMAEAMVSSLRQSLGATGVQTYFFDIPTPVPDGPARHFEARLTPCGPGEALAMVRDITAEVHAEEAARQSAERLQLLTATTPVYILELGRDGTISFVNRAFEGTSREQILGTALAEWLPLEHRPGFSALLDSVLATGEARHIEYSLLDSTGKPRAFHMQLTPITQDGARESILVTANDITEREEAEEALRESEAALARAQRVARIGSFERDLRTDKVFWSQQLGRMIGVSDEQEVTFDMVQSFMHPEDRAAWELALQRVVEEGRPMSIEMRMIRTDGAILWVHNETELERDASGQPLRVFGTVQDITQRKEAEEALRAEKERSQTYLDVIGSLIVVVDPQCRVAMLNKSGARILECAPEWAVGRDYFDTFLPEETRQEVRGIFSRAMAGELGMDEWHENEVLTARGNRRLMRWHNSLVRDAEWHIVGFLASGEDITEQRQAELAAQASEERFRELYSHMTSGVAIYEPIDDGRDFTIRDINEAGQRLIRSSIDEIRGKTMLEAFPGAPEMGFLAVLQDVYQSGQPHFLPATYYHDERIAHWVENSIFKLPSGEVVAVYDNVTERVQAEEGLRWELSLNAELAALASKTLAVSVDLPDVAQATLKAAQRLTGSEHGFVSIIDPTSRTASAYTFGEMIEGQCGVDPKRMPLKLAPDADGLYPGLWGVPLNEGRAFYTNAPAEHPSAHGVPSGHVRLRSFLSAPAMVGGRAAGQIAVANGDAPYTERDVAAVQHLAEIYAMALERERSRAALQESERRLATLLGHLPGMAFRSLNDPQYTALFVSDGSRAVTGYSPDQLTGSNQARYAELIHPDDRARVWDEIQAAIEAQRPYEVEYRITDAAGRTRWVWEQGSGVRSPEGEILFVEGYITDVTERKTATEALRNERDLLHTLMDSAPDRIFFKDRQLRYVRANPPQAKGLGRATPEDLVGRTDRELISDSERVSTWYEEELRVMSTGLPMLAEERSLPDADGVARWWSVTKVPLRDEESAVVGLLGIVRDITAQRQLEAQLAQAQKMEAVGRLAGGVAHDFNNILFAIGGYAESLLGGPAGQEPDGRRDLIELQGAVEQATSLTGQLLAFSRRQVAQPRPLDLNRVVAEARGILGRLIGEDVALDTDLDPDLRAVRADPVQMSQVIINLAINARDAMPNGGTLTIGTANVVLDEGYVNQHFEAKPGRYVMLSVGDTGVGMDAQTMGHLFEPFFTTKAVGKGTGLGLSTIYGIVRSAGGHIDVHSEVGKGASFRIYFPALEERVAGARLVSDEIRGGSETILVVEDNDRVRVLTQRALARRGYRVLAACDGEEALGIADGGEQIDLLLTDVVMPGMGGPALARRLAATRPQLRVLYMSGFTDGTALRHSGPGVAPDFIQKPFGSIDLARKVRELLDS